MRKPVGFVILASTLVGVSPIAVAAPPEPSPVEVPLDPEEPVTIEAAPAPAIEAEQEPAIEAEQEPAPEQEPVRATDPLPPPAPTAPTRAPALGQTDVTVFNAVSGEESEVGPPRYRIGKGLVVSTKDRRFSLELRARAQFRYDLEHPNVEGEPVEHLLQVRRFRIQLRGNVFSPYVKYYIQFGFSIQDMSSGLPSDAATRRIPIRDARLEFDRLRDFSIWIGQFKVPFSRQRVNSSSALNMVDRTGINGEFSLDRDLGIQASSRDLGGLGGKLAYQVGVFMGEGRNAYQFSDPGLLYVARFEVLPFGSFEDYSEGDLVRSKRPGLSLAAAYAFQDRAHPARGVLGDPAADGGTTNFHHFTADLLLKWQGVSLNTAFHLRKGFARESGGALDDLGLPIPTVAARSGMAWFGQLGWVVPKIPLEFVGRYGLTRNTFGAASSQPESDEAGGGINWYFVDHNLKLQFDYFRLWNPSLGESRAEQARHGTDRIRVQFQLFF